MKHVLVFLSIAIAMLCQLSCASDEAQTELENPVASDLINAAPLLGDVVLENMYEDEVLKLTDKTPVQIVTVLEGTNRVVLNARFRGVRYFNDLGFPLYECELMDASAEAMGGIAQGMSGSPVGPPGQIMGALSYGMGFSKPPTRFWVTSIDAMEATIDHRPMGEFLEAAPAAPGVDVSATYAPVKTPVMVSGVTPQRLQEFASHLDETQHNFVELFADIGGAPAAPPAGATQKLAAGDMIGAALATGDMVNVIGYGTVTQVYNDGTFIAFGHHFFGSGKSQLPVYRAVVNGIFPSLIISRKSVSAYGNPIGTITKDLAAGIVGELGAPPPMIPVTTTYHPANSPTPIVKHHRVAYGQESYIRLVAAGTIEQLRMESSHGTVDGTIALAFEETDATYTESFRSSSSAVYTDVKIHTGRIISAFSDTQRNAAGKATFKSVSISVTDKPQIAKAKIAEVLAPDEIQQGDRATVSIVLVPHWNAAGVERTIQRDITLDIPEDFPTGEATLSVSASAAAPQLPPLVLPDGLVIDIGETGPADEAKQPIPKNLDELIKQLEEEQVDAGLITITLTASGIGGDLLTLPGVPLPEDLLPSTDDDGEGMKPLETELTIDNFIVSGNKEVTVTIKGEDTADITIPEVPGVPILPPALDPEEE